MRTDLIEVVENIQNKRILVIGDLLLDKYIWGEVERISPEAPVPIVKVQKETYAPGGASNVANNIVAVGGNAKVLGIVGEDKEKDIFLAELKRKNIDTNDIIIDAKRPTIQKIRIMAQRQQLLRIDVEETSSIENIYEDIFLRRIEEQEPEIDAVVVSDYGKGMITKKFMESLVAFCKKNGKKIIVDPKPQNKEFYKGATVITPNHKEACELAEETITNNEDIIAVGKKVQEELQANILVTRGENGMTLFEKEKEPVTIPTKAREVYDVTGAGDTVVAIVALALGSGATLQQAAELANIAAGIVVGKVGTATVSAEELKRAIEKEE